MAKNSGKRPGRDLAQWDEQMAADANMAAGTASSAAGGGSFSIRGGILTFQGNRMPDDQMAVIIADGMLVNQWYDNEPFDENDRKSPYCFATGRDAGVMVPHEQSVNPQCEACVDCEHNRFGSAETGRGKACKNGWRLLCVSAGELDREGNLKIYETDFIEGQALATLNVPPTSAGAYASFVQQLQSAFKRPPYAFVAKVKIYPHPKHKMAAISFEAVMDIRKEAPDLVPVVMALNKKAMKENNEFAFTPNEEGDGRPAPAQQRRQRAGKVAGTEPRGRPVGQRQPRRAAAEPQESPRRPARMAKPKPAPRQARQPREPVATPAPAGRPSKFRREPAPR